MIPGATAADEGSAPAAPAGPPAAVGTLDFVNNVYTWMATSRTLAQVVNLTARRSASGLSIIPSTPVQLLGDPLAFTLLANWTIVCAFQVTATIHRQYMLTVFDAGFNDQIAVYSEQEGVAFEDSGVTTRTAFGNFSYSTGTFRIGATRVTARISVSVNGEAAVADSTSINISSWTFAPSQVQIADSNGTGSQGFIQKMSFYNPVSDAVLATLSA